MPQLDSEEHAKVLITLRQNDVEWNQATFNHYALTLGLTDIMWVNKGRMYIKASPFELHGRRVFPGNQVAMRTGAKHCLSSV